MRKFVVFSMGLLAIFLTTAPCPATAAGTDEYSKWKICVAQEKSPIYVSLGSKKIDEKLALCPQYKATYDHLLHDPWEKRCPHREIFYAEIEVDCSCYACKDGQKLSDCVMPSAHREACAKLIAFTGIKEQCENDYVKQELLNKCGPEPAKPAPKLIEATYEIPDESVDIDDDLEITNAKIKKEKKQKDKKTKEKPATGTSQEQNKKPEGTTTDDAAIAAATKAFQDDMAALRDAFIKKIQDLQAEKK